MASLNQIPPEKRIIFLKRFTAEIMLSRIKEIQTKQKIEQEKIKQKILSPIQEPEIPLSPVFQASKFADLPEQTPGPVMSRALEQTTSLDQLRKPIAHKIRTPRLILIQKQRPIQQQQFQQQPIQQKQFQKSNQITPKIPPQIRALKEIKPQAKPRPEGFALGRIESLLKNKDIQSIECPGPNKNLLVKKYNKINITRIKLDQIEITDVLHTFAKQAKIPIVGGILKAAVGDLVISAVISEFVGSRFIVNKITPYSIIQK